MLLFAFLLTPLKKVKIQIPKEEVFVDDGGPIYYEAEPEEERPPEPEPEEPFVDDITGPLYYEAGEKLPEDTPQED